MFLVKDAEIASHEEHKSKDALPFILETDKADDDGEDCVQVPINTCLSNMRFLVDKHEDRVIEHFQNHQRNPSSSQAPHNFEVRPVYKYVSKFA